MTNSADPDQKPTDLELHCLQTQDTSVTNRTRVNRPGLKLRPECFYLKVNGRLLKKLLSGGINKNKNPGSIKKNLLRKMHEKMQ